MAVIVAADEATVRSTINITLTFIMWVRELAVTIIMYANSINIVTTRWQTSIVTLRVAVAVIIGNPVIGIAVSFGLCIDAEATTGLVHHVAASIDAVVEAVVVGGTVVDVPVEADV